MRRIISASLAAILLILCFADAWLWYRGYTLGDTVVYRWIPQPTTLRFIQLYSERGGLRIMIGTEAYPLNSPPQLFGWEPGLHHGSFGGPTYPIQTWGDGKLWGAFGFYCYRLTSPFPSAPGEIRLHRSARASPGSAAALAHQIRLEFPPPPAPARSRPARPVHALRLRYPRTL